MTNKIVTTIGAAGIGAVATAAVLLTTQAGAQSTPVTAAAAAAPSSSSTAPATPGAKHHRGALRLHRIQHGTWVTRAGKDSTTFVTHSAVQGSVTAVSATSISVKSPDNYSATFAVTKDTKVRVWTNGKLTSSSISAVKSGTHVMVAGVGTPTATARHILVGTRK